MGGRQILFSLIVLMMIISSCSTKKSAVSEHKENIVMTDSSHVSEKNATYNLTDIRKDSVASVESAKSDCTIIVVNDTGKVIYKESYRIKYMNRYIDRIQTIYVKDSSSVSIDTTKVVASKNSVEDTKITTKDDKHLSAIAVSIAMSVVGILLWILIIKSDSK